MRKGAPGQHDKGSGVPKEKGIPRWKGRPPGEGVPRGQGVLPGEGLPPEAGRPKDEGVMPGAEGQRARGGDGQVDRGAPGQMDPWAPNPWALEDDFEEFPESPDEEFLEAEGFAAQHPNFMGEAAAAEE